MTTNVEIDDEKRKKLRKPLQGETEEQKRFAKEIIEAMDTAYVDRERDLFDGPIGLGEGLDLRDDFFSFTFVYWLKRKEIIGGDEDSDPEDIEDLNKNKV